MIGHLIRYHPAFIALLAQVKGGAIGKLRHIQANRLAMGRIRSTESALFDLCPHDLSLISGTDWKPAHLRDLSWRRPHYAWHYRCAVHRAGLCQ